MRLVNAVCKSGCLASRDRSRGPAITIIAHLKNPFFQNHGICAISNSWLKYVGIHLQIIAVLSFYLIMQRVISLAKYNVFCSSDYKIIFSVV